MDIINEINYNSEWEISKFVSFGLHVRAKIRNHNERFAKPQLANMAVY